jgi:hypothetical protein
MPGPTLEQLRPRFTEVVMRAALATGLALLALPHAVLAQSGPYLAVVGDAEVKLRAGPSDKYLETATLRPGSPIVVDHEEENGWLAVTDPQGKAYSVSWVLATYIDFDNAKPTPQPVMVHGEGEATLAAGQFGLQQPLHIRRTKVPAGTGLLVIGQKVKFEERWWYPVMPPAGDFRYLPKQAVRYDKPAATAFTVRDTTPPPSAPVASLPPVTPGGGSRPPVGVEPAGPATTASKPAVQNPLWAQAEAAERDGRLDDAEKLYFQLAQVMNQPGGDHDTANLCYTRIHTLREKKRTGGNAVATNPRPATGGGTPARVGSPPPPEPRAEDGLRWTGPGKLARSALAPEGRRTYVLTSARGDTLWYVVAGPGVDLEKYLGKRIDVYGTSGTYRDLSKPYMTASRVEVAQ